MEVKEKTLASVMQEAAQAEAQLPENTSNADASKFVPTVPTDTPVTTESAPNTTPNNDAQPQPQPAPSNETPVTIDDEVVEFEQPSFEVTQPQSDAQPQPQQQQPQATSWKDALKDEAQRSEIIKELGIDPLVLELNEHIKRGGKAEDYLNAKAIDYNKVSDRDIILQDLKEKYPTLTTDKINRLYEVKYKQAESYEDDVKELGLIELEADAANARMQRIQKQQSFKLPEPVQQQPQAAQQPNPEAERVAAETQQFFQKLFDSEATKNLMQSKKVAIQLGEGVKPINVSIKNPQELFDVVFNPETAKKTFLTPQGEPDVQKILEFGLFKSNPELFKKLVRGNAKEMATQALVEEGQNATRPGSVIPMNGEKFSNVGEAFNSGQVTIGKLGNYDR